MADYNARLATLRTGLPTVGQASDIRRFLTTPVGYGIGDVDANGKAKPADSTTKLSNGSVIRNAVNIPSSQSVGSKNPVIFVQVTKPIIDGRHISIASSDIMSSTGSRFDPKKVNLVLGEVSVQGYGPVKLAQLHIFNELVSQIAYPPFNKDQNVCFVAAAWQLSHINPSHTPFRIELELQDLNAAETATVSVMMIVHDEVCSAMNRIILGAPPANESEEALKRDLVVTRGEEEDPRKQQKIDLSKCGITTKMTFYEPIKLKRDGQSDTLTFTATAPTELFAGILIFSSDLYSRKLNYVRFLDSSIPGYLCRGPEDTQQLNFYHSIKGDALNAYNSAIFPLLKNDIVEFEFQPTSGDTSPLQAEYNAYMLTYRVYNLSIKGVARM